MISLITRNDVFLCRVRKISGVTFLFVLSVDLNVLERAQILLKIFKECHTFSDLALYFIDRSTDT